MPLEELTGAEDAERQLQRGGRRLPRVAEPRPPPPRRLLPLRRTRRGRWSGWGASAPAPGSSCCSAGTRGDPLFLQAKEAGRSVLEPYVGREPRTPPRPPRGRRAAADAGGERHLPRLGDGRPGSTAQERCFYVRQLWDGKGSAEVERMSAAGAGRLRRPLRRSAGARPRPLRRPHRDRLLPRRRRGLRQGARRASPRPTPTATKATSSSCATAADERPDRGRGGASREPGGDPAGGPRPPPRRRHPAAALRGAGRLRPRRRRDRARRGGDDRPPQRPRLAGCSRGSPCR